jgi:hypothetical protein
VLAVEVRKAAMHQNDDSDCSLADFPDFHLV